MSTYPTGTVTLLFTDIEGSTLLLRKLADRYGEALTTHRTLLRSAFEASGGHEIDTQGDSFFIAFASVRDALEAAVAAQRALGREEWPCDAEVRVRMGIHTGEPAVGDEGYLGLDVHRAARISSAAHGGQILLSQSTRELAGDVLPSGTQLEGLGEHRLKDLPRPERLFQLIVPGLRSTFPPLKDVDRQEATASPFLGHERELAARVAHAVFDKTRRLSKRAQSSQPGFAELAWEIRGLALEAPRELQAELGALGGKLFSLGRTGADFERYIAAVDRRLLERKLRESKEMAVVSRRIGVEADALTEHVARFESLAKRRAELATLGAESEAALGRIRRNLDSDLDAVHTDVGALCTQVERLEREVRSQLEEVRSALGDLGVSLKRTRHRGVYHAGNRYVVPFSNEVGTEERREFSSLDEATAFRRAVRFAAHARLEPEKDWKTVGKTFRATDALGGEGPSYVRPVDEGRPRH
jgi:class 3 adenylate cyclase